MLANTNSCNAEQVFAQY